MMKVEKGLFKNKFKQVVLGTSVFAISMILGTGNCSAVLQSNGNTPAQYNLNSWMINIRNMEAIGGAMGLSETVNSNLTASSTSNNIDVHMEKNTEYGAMAILSASSYGNPNKVENGGTTTGNITGAVINLNKEWVAAGSLGTGNFSNAVARYKNIYENTYIAKAGDAIFETNGWHDANSVWDLTYALVRARSGSIFSYYGDGMSNGNKLDAYYTKAWSSRAVVVIGEGL